MKNARFGRLANRRKTLETKLDKALFVLGSEGRERDSPSLPYVDELGVVTLLQVVEDRSIVEVGQIGHILGFLILGRVHLLQLVLLEVPGLSSGPEGERKDELAVIDHDNRLT